MGLLLLNLGGGGGREWVADACFWFMTTGVALLSFPLSKHVPRALKIASLPSNSCPIHARSISHSGVLKWQSFECWFALQRIAFLLLSSYRFLEFASAT